MDAPTVAKLVQFSNIDMKHDSETVEGNDPMLVNDVHPLYIE